MSNLQTITEVFKSVIGYEGLYEVSDFGQVKSLSREIHFIDKTGNPATRICKEIIKKSAIDKYGYSCITLCKNAKKIHFTIHRLVAISFIPNTENKPQINHIDGNKLNNSIHNLEWCTAIENVHHAISKGLFMVNGRKKNLYKCAQPSRRKPVMKMDISGNIICIYESITVAAGTAFTVTHIGDCCNGKAKTHGGFKWAYYNKAVSVLNAVLA